MAGYVSIETFVREGWKEGTPLKDAINYACGIKPMPEWTNADYFDGSVLWQFKDTGIPKDLLDAVVHLDLLQPHPFPDCSFRYAYCEDFIEHVDQKSSLRFLVEVYRTLAPGGIFRLSTPSFENVLLRHFNRADAKAVERGIADAFDPWGHMHFYSHATLKAAARALGFVNYTECEYRVSSHTRLANLETRSEQIGLNLYAEMFKPL